VCGLPRKNPQGARCPGPRCSTAVLAALALCNTAPPAQARSPLAGPPPAGLDLRLLVPPTECLFLFPICAGPQNTMLGGCARGSAGKPGSASGTPCPFFTLFPQDCAQPGTSGVDADFEEVFLETPVALSSLTPPSTNSGLTLLRLQSLHPWPHHWMVLPLGPALGPLMGEPLRLW